MTEKFNRIKQQSEEYLERRVMRLLESKAQDHLKGKRKEEEKQKEVEEEEEGEEEDQVSKPDTNIKIASRGNSQSNGAARERKRRNKEQEAFQALKAKVTGSKGTKASVMQRALTLINEQSEEIARLNLLLKEKEDESGPSVKRQRK